MAYSFPNPKHAPTTNGVYIAKVQNHDTWPRLLAEGDSWFDYPDFDVVKALESLGHVPWNVSRAGDTIRNIRAGNFAQIEKALNMSIIKGTREPFRCVLFSGGGNDMLGDGLPYIINTAVPGSAFPDWINRERLSEQVSILKDSFRDLHNFVQFVRPGLPVLVHSYDYAVPSGQALEIAGIIKLAGPWIRNVLYEKAIREPEDQTAIVRALVDELSGMHLQLESEFHNTYRFVDCRGCVQTDQWANEIHPKRSGFLAVAQRFQNAIAAL